MAKKVEIKDPFERKDSMVTESGHLVEKGDVIKVSGQYGLTFKFQSLTTNPVNGKVWVDCFELQRGVAGPSRSFYPQDIKATLKRGRRVKRT